MSVDVFLLINLLALFHRNTALPARIPSPGRAPRPSCVIPKPRLPKLHSCFPTDPDSICLPSSVLTAPLGLLYSAVVPKGACSIRDQHKPPNPLVSTLGSDWRRAQARWLNANHQAEASGQAPILSKSMVLHSNVSPGVHPHRDLPSCHKPRLDKMVSAGGPQLSGTHDQWLVKRLNPVPVVIGDDFDGLFCGSALLGLKSLPHPLSWVWGRSVFGFL